jgi:hypothetical protein
MGPLALYIYYGWNDALCQVWIYWLMGTLSPDAHAHVLNDTCAYKW